MTNKRSSQQIVVEGTVSQDTWDEGWGEEGVVIVTPESDEYDEYFVEPDEVGRELAEHLFEFVRVYGTLRKNGSRRQLLRVSKFQVINTELDDDTEWNYEVEEDSSWEDERLLRSLGHGSFDF